VIEHIYKRVFVGLSYKYIIIITIIMTKWIISVTVNINNNKIIILINIILDKRRHKNKNWTNLPDEHISWEYDTKNLKNVVSQLRPTGLDSLTVRTISPGRVIQEGNYTWYCYNSTAIPDSIAVLKLVSRQSGVHQQNMLKVWSLTSHDYNLC
jgi:hypothetical protein